MDTLKNIEEIWVFSREGIPLLNFSKEKCLNESLMGAFISALKSFVKELSKKNDLKSINLADHKFTLLSCCEDSAILVIRTKSDIGDRKIKKLCKILIEIFENLYDKNDIISWDGNQDRFNTFKEKVEVYFKLSNL